MKMRYIILEIAVLGVLLPETDTLSMSRWTYMLGHGGWVHYALNMTSWLLMWRIATPGRTLVAYLTAVACHFIPDKGTVVGWSVVIYFFLGMMLCGMPNNRRWRIVGCLALGAFLPYIAAWHHAAMLACGWIYRKVEERWVQTLY